MIKPLTGVSYSTKYPPYLARDTFGHYQNNVVVKLLADPPGPGRNDRDRHRALNEMAMPVGFIHENLAEVLDSDIDPVNGCYTVTNFYPTTLEAFLNDPANAKVVTLSWCLTITKQILAGLSAAWDRQFVHLDIKPANIGLDADGTVKIFDFGLVQNWQIENGGHANTTAGAKFTQFYAPPEQMSRPSGWINRAADVRAVGATLYRMITGRPPLHLEARAPDYET